VSERKAGYDMPGWTRSSFHPQVRISVGQGLSKSTAALHLRRKVEFYKARDEYRAALKERSSSRVKAFSEAAVACLVLDQDKPL
jgi:hypothetical protein